MFKFAFTLTIILAAALPAAGAQERRFSIGGIVLDPSGAPTLGASVSMRTSVGAVQEATTDLTGRFQFDGLLPGEYTVRIQCEGFAPFSTPVRITNRAPGFLRAQLKLAELREEVTVSAVAADVSAETAENRDAVVAGRQLLEALPVFDQDYVAAMSRFLDPGSVATSGATLIVDGMEQRSAGVSASGIQEVRINQNPYAAEFARPGRGRIEITTKAAQPAYHGAINFLTRDYRLNARDTFATTRPPEQRRIYEGSLTGPLGANKKTSFLITADHEVDDLEAVVFASGPKGLITENAANPRRHFEYSGSATHQLTDSHVISLRGSFLDQTEENRGVGGSVLPEAGVNFEHREDELVYRDTYNLAPSLLNQFHLLLGREHETARSVTNAPGVVVPDSFTGGGAQADYLLTETHFQLNDFVSWTAGKHQMKAGINVPDFSRRGYVDRANFAGVLTYASLQDYEAGRPLSLVQQAGNGKVVFVEIIAGGFIQDEYRIRPNFMISAGVRFDWQNFVHDNNNFSPRLSFARGLGKSGRTVLRGGAGFFYDRTGVQPFFDLKRYNGLQLHRVVLSSPPSAEPLPPALLALEPGSVVRLAKSIDIPYTFQYSLGVERRLWKSATLAATYWGTRGVDLFRSRDVNAPPPPMYLERPDPSIGVYRQIETSGHLESDSFEVTFRGDLTKRFNGLVQYSLGRAMSDVPGNYSAGTRTAGIESFPANNYDLSGEWGRADYDQRHRFNALGSFKASRYLDLGVGFFANSGQPYTMTTGLDANHDGLANDRPSGVGRNTLQGPGYVEWDLRWSHEWLIHKDRSKGPKFNAALDAFNVTNRTNYTTYVGNESSPFFGRAVTAKPPRRLQLSLRFTF